MIEIDLQYNAITSLAPATFHGLHILRELYLGYNLLKNLPAGCFSGLPALSQLNLEANQLNTLNWNVFDPQVKNHNTQ